MISSDKPINDLQEDKLEREEFINNIFRIIKDNSNKDGIVLGVEGKWGSGKTSVLNILENKLLSENRLVFKFNPWNFSTRKQLISDFFEQFSLFAGARTNLKKELKNVSEKLKLISNILKPIGMIPGASPIINILEKGVKVLSNSFSETSEQIDFESIKKGLEDYLNQLDQKIIVFIDDIDRIPDDEIREIFQLVKGVGNLTNVVYLLSYDKNVVVQALNKTQEKKGEEYLDKIIQLEFKLPKIKTEKIINIFFDEYIKCINESKEFGKNISLYREFYTSGLFNKIKSFRNIKKILNSIYFSLDYAKQELFLPHFLALKILENFEYKIVEYIFFNKQEFIQTEGEIFRKIEDDEKAEKIKKFLRDNVKSFSFEEIYNILRILFPQMIKGKVENIGYNNSYKLDNRISNERHFYKYFKYSLSEEEISNYEVKYLFSLSNIEELNREFERLISKNKITEFLNSMLEQQEKYLNNQNIKNIIISLIQNSKKIEDLYVYKGVFDLENNELKIIRIIYNFIRNLDIKYKVYEELINELDVNYYLIYLINYFEKNEVFTSEELEKLKNKIVKKIKDNLLLSERYENHLLEILYNMKKWNELEVIDKILDRYLKTDERLLKLISLFVQESRTEKNGELLVNKYISKEVIEDFLDYNDIKSRLTSINLQENDEIMKMFLNPRDPRNEY